MPTSKTEKHQSFDTEPLQPKPISMNNVEAARVLEKVSYKQCMAACDGDQQEASNLKFSIDIAVKELRRVRPGQTWQH